MNRAALIALIETLKSNDFTSAVEKLIAVVLTFIDNEGEPLQQCEIIEILTLDEKHCRNALGKLVESKLFKTFGKRTIFYQPTAPPPPLEQASPPLEQASPPPSFSSNGSEFKFNIHESQFESESESNSIKKKISKTKKTQAKSKPSRASWQGPLQGEREAGSFTL